MPRKKAALKVINEKWEGTDWHGKQKISKLKPFSVSNFTFYPCNFRENIKKGYIYFLLCRGRFGYTITENNSPMFKTKQEAEAFVLNNKNFSLKPV